MTTPTHAAFRGRLSGALPRTRRDHGPALSRTAGRPFRCSRRGAVRPKARYRPGTDLPGVRREPCTVGFGGDFAADMENEREVGR